MTLIAWNYRDLLLLGPTPIIATQSKPTDDVMRAKAMKTRQMLFEE